MADCLLTSAPIDISALISAASSPASGAVTLFLGNVRQDIIEAQPVTALHYEAYEQMALKLLEAIRSEAVEKFGLNACQIVHRLGQVELTESSIAVLTAAAHRQPTLEAASWIMDQLKRRAPIWKKDIFEGGSRWRDDPTG